MAWDAHSQRAPARLSRRSLLRALALACATPASALLSACWGGGDDDDEAPTAFVDSQATTAPPPGPGTPPPSPTERADATTMTPAPNEPTATRQRASTATRTATPVRSTPTPIPGGPTATTADPTATPVATAPAPVIGGTLRLLSFAAAQILNPHLVQTTPSVVAGRIALEPLFDFDDELNPILVLGAEWPTVPRGLLDPFGRWVIWRLRTGVRWHDGELFSASDVRFTWEYATSGLSLFPSAFGDALAEIEIIDPGAVRLVFTRPNPNWIDLFRGGRGVILPEHVFRPLMSESIYQQTELANLMPIGTGPWRVVGNNTQEGWVRFERFPDYWDVGKPYCDEVVYLSGGSAEIHAQQVLRDGEAEWASFLTNVDPVVLTELAAAGEGVLAQPRSSLVERLHFNFSAPGSGMDGSALTPHPHFSDLRVRRALALAMPRDEIVVASWGPSGVAETHILASPSGFQGPGVPSGPDLDAARALLSEAGVSGGELTILTTSGSSNAPRTLTVQRIRETLEGLGFSVTVRETDSSQFFAPGVDTEDSLARFNGDLMVYGHGGVGPYPLDWARRYRSDEIAQETNRWTGENIARYNNPAFDALHDQAQQAIDPQLQQELWQRMMTLVEEDIVEIPLVRRSDVAAVSNRVSGWSVSGWAENPSYDLKNWRLAAG